MRRRIILIVILLIIIAGGVTWTLKQKSVVKPTPVTAPIAAAAPTLEFLPSEIFTAKPLELQQTLSLTGALRAVDISSVKARVAAEVREISVREGDTVRAGQIVARMDATEFQARVDQARGTLNAARAQLDIATKNRDNNRTLVEKGFISKNAFDNSASQYATAEANVEAAKGALDVVQKLVNDTVIRSPISGVVAMRYVQAGEKVSADNKLLDIVNLQKMELEAAVPTNDITNVAIGQRVTLRTEGLPQTIEGKVVRINPATQSGSRSVLVYVQIANPQNQLRSGMFAEAQLILKTKASVLALPQNAIRKEGNRAYVYVIEADVLARKAITVGMSGRSGDDYMTEVLSGIDFGTQIVRTDMGSLQPGTHVRINAPSQ
ncbi:MAG: efflux RND transporter periplasmic adaptor subunit [Sulfuritalea sp.]|nr:efflux RND transporter periplasmic adaptor subunit [Polynucleobacter sp.]MCF8188934.1 efflux RND transporter periplasmic adaptor subunit [Sulfuritalea sp.]